MSSDSSRDPVESAAKGAVRAGLEWTEEKVKQLAHRFQNRDIIFVGDPKTIEIAKEQRKTSEWGLFKNYVEDEELRILFQMGLTLRRLEKEESDFKPLKDKIHNKYGARGVHIANFVQNGFFSKYVGNILDKALTDNELKLAIHSLLENIDKTVSFINNRDDSKQKTGDVVTKIQAHSPNTFIISSAGSATNICDKVHKDVMQKVSSTYTSELYVSEEGEGKKIYFLNRISD